MSNSSYTLQQLIDIARSLGDVAPTLPVGGAYETVALSSINDAMTAMLAGSHKGSQFNFKFNRILPPPFFVNSFQQDYAQNNVNIGWLESAGAYNTSSTQQPKPFRTIEAKRDILITNSQTSDLAKIVWEPNKTLQFGVWGQATNVSLIGLTNPGPNVLYQNPVGLLATPPNPITQHVDAFGNFWYLTQYGTCGAVNPFLTNQNPNKQWPTFANPAITPIVVTDGTVQWTGLNPDAQGFRINPMPTQVGPVWQVQTWAQARIQQFTTIQQFLEPIPDDYFKYIKQGFITYLYKFHPDQKMRLKFKDEYDIWMQDLDNCVRQGSREEDDWGFVPSSNVMDTGWAFNPVNPAQPYGPWAG